MGIKIRESLDADMPLLYAMAVAMHSESPRYRDFPLSEAKLQDLMGQIHVGSNAVILVAHRGDKIIGMLWGYLTEPFFSEYKFSTDILWYVLPSHRDGKAGAKLAHAFEEWGKPLGAQHTNLSMSTGIDNRRAAGFAERMGYTETGIVLSKAN